MVGLIDIAPAIETVDVQGTSVTVHGVSAKGLASLLGRFPELRMLMTGREVQTEQLMADGEEVLADDVEAGLGQEVMDVRDASMQRILDRDDAEIGLAAANGVDRVLEGRARNIFDARQRLARGEIGIGAGLALEGDGLCARNQRTHG